MPSFICNLFRERKNKVLLLATTKQKIGWMKIKMDKFVAADPVAKTFMISHPHHKKKEITALSFPKIVCLPSQDTIIYFLD